MADFDSIRRLIFLIFPRKQNKENRKESVNKLDLERSEKVKTIHEWDEAYRTGKYQNFWGISYPSQELVAFVASLDPTHPIVAVDVGCGAGQEAIFLAQQGFSVIGIDQSEEAIKIAKSQSEKAGVIIDWRISNVLQLPVADASVDVINDRGCFHHIPNEHRAQYAAEMARILKPNGKMLLRGCREEKHDPFIAVTENAIHHYFSPYFTSSPVLPIELANNEQNNLPANLVILTRR